MKWNPEELTRVRIIVYLYITELLDSRSHGNKTYYWYSYQGWNWYSIIDEENNKLYGKEQMDRIAEETYFKYRGEEIIKQSGLRWVDE